MLWLRHYRRYELAYGEFLVRQRVETNRIGKPRMARELNDTERKLLKTEEEFSCRLENNALRRIERTQLINRLLEQSSLAILERK